LVSPPDAGERASQGTPDPAPTTPARPAGSRVLLMLICLVTFLVCFGGALAATQQLR
jgi:hypothetical protein